MPTILLTSYSQPLVEAARAAMPQAQVQPIGPTPPTLTDGNSWCFVDWLLDDTSGLEVCRNLRANPGTRASHITMVLDSGSDQSKSRAIEAGADDYIPGPLTPEKLADRLNKYLGRFETTSGPVHYPGGFALDTAAHQARWRGRVIPLRPREMRVFQLFLARPDHLLSRAQILALLELDGEIGDERTVDKWVGCLRQTLEKHGAGGLLRTVRSLGYVFDSP